MKMLSTEELRMMEDRGVDFALIDVLPAKDFERTRIPKAMSIPLEEPNFAARVEEAVGRKDRRVVVYCASNDCPASTTAARQLEAAGFTDVADYKGGAEAWHESE